MEKFLSLDLRRNASPPKKRKRLCTYRKEYTEEFPFIKSSKRGDTFVFCETCRTDLSIGSGGHDDLMKHVQREKHIRAAQDLKNSTKINGFFASSSDNSVIQAEVLFTKFLVDCNIPLSASDTFNKLVKRMFPDSDIAKKFACGRTKATAIAQTLATDSCKATASKMKTMPYSLSTDGSNDHDSKLYPVVIRQYDESKGQIATKLLSVPELQSASTAENIAKLVTDQLQRFSVPVEKCAAFSADNANVMMGKKGGVCKLLQDQHPGMVGVGCPCHLINIAAKTAAKALPIKIDEVLVDVFYFFRHSDKRKADFDKFQQLYNEEVKKILKYCPTRWLCLKPCIDRLIELWKPLHKYTLDVVNKEKEKEQQKRKSKAEAERKKGDHVIASMFGESAKEEGSEESPATRLHRIMEFVSSRRNLVLTAFLQRIMPIFDEANKILQSEEPLVHKTRDILMGLLRNILTQFIKPKVLALASDLTQIDITTNHLADKDLDIGDLAHSLMSNMSSKAKASIYSSVKTFLMTAAEYIITKLPLKNPVFVNAPVVDINRRLDAEFQELNFFTTCHPSDCPPQVLRDEFRLYKSYPLPDYILQEKRCDRQWHLLRLLKNPANNKALFFHLATAMLSVLCIPHSNADAERVFSMVRKNRTEQRACLSNRTLEALLVAKIDTEPVCSAVFSNDLLRRCKRATMESLASESNSK